MNSRVAGLRVASVVFGFMFLGQLGRLILGVPVTVGSRVVPLWPSGVALVVLGVLCAWLWRLSLSTPPAVPAEPAPQA